MALSIRDMAAALGVSKSQVQRDKAAGMPMSDAGAAQSWRQQHHDVSRTREGRIDRASVSSLPVTSVQAPAQGDDDQDDDGGDTAAYRAARTEREQIRRDRERIELQREQGQVVDRDEVARLRFTEFRALRDALGNLALRTAPALAVEADPIVCERIVRAALDDVLQTFASQVLTRDVTQDVDEDDDEAD